MKLTKISNFACSDAPVPGARRVYWWIDNQWVEKGWLMPEVENGRY